MFPGIAYIHFFRPSETVLWCVGSNFPIHHQPLTSSKLLPHVVQASFVHALHYSCLKNVFSQSLWSIWLPLHVTCCNLFL